MTDAEAQEAWDRFIAHIEKKQPLGHYQKVKGKLVYVSQPHTHFLGSINEYKKIYLAAQREV